MRQVLSKIGLLAILMLAIGTIGALAQNVTVNPSADDSDSPMVIGICDTAGPIEIESSGGTTVPTAYATLAAAFTAINGGTHTGAIAIDVCGDTTEPVAGAILNASGSGTASYTAITMAPAGGAARTIAGAATAGLPLVDFNGADNVTINGLNAGGNTLTISNTTASATSGTSTIRFIGGATGNTVTNSTILGSFSGAVGTNGGNIFFSTDAVTTAGNDNNTISNNNITSSGSGLTTKGVYGNGSTTTTAINNSGVIITGNNIFDFFGAAVASAGVYVSTGNTDWTISNNRLYQTAARTQTTGATHSGIQIATTAGNNFQITGNTVGFASNTGAGVYTFVGITSSVFIPINLSVGTTTASGVQGNTIAGIAQSGASSGTSSSAPFRGIYVGSGLATVGDVTGNTIGSQTPVGSITYTSSATTASDVIAIFNFGSSNFVSNNNNIGGITASNSSTGPANVYGIRVNTTSTATWICNNNIIGGTIANSLQSTSTAAGTAVQGILNSSPLGTFTGNTIRNLTAAGGTGTVTSASVAGIVIVATVNQTISRNTITALSNTNTTAATTVTGIQFNGGTANIVERNYVAGLASATTSAAAEVNGIRVAGGTTIYRNNMITFGDGIPNAVGTGSTTGGVNGINEPLGTDSFFHNSVYIGGAPTAGVGPSYAFNSSQTTNTRSFRNNIFFNGRSNNGATGKNYIVRVGGTTANPAGLTINNNVYFANGNGAVFGFFNGADVATLAAFQAAVGQDANSIFADPAFVSTTDLHLTMASPARDIGANVGVANDFDNESRPGANALFDIGADEFDGIAPLANDIAATAIINPANGASGPVGITTAPQASFTNVGTATQTNVAVQFTITGPGGYTYTDTQTIATIAPNQTVTVTFAVTPAFTTPGTYTSTATVTTADGNATNNTVSATFTILAPIAGGTFNVPGDYPSLTNAGGVFAALNAAGASGNIVINIAADLTGETGANALNPLAAGITVTIKPGGGTARTITSTTTATRVIAINGADNVTIDGSLNSGTDRSLSIINANTTTSGTTVLTVGSLGAGAGANNVTIKNTVIQNGTNFNTTTTSFNFGIFAGSGTAAGADNDNLTIQNNLIQRCQIGMQIVGSAATGAGVLDNLVIADNTIGGTAAADFVGLEGMIFGNAIGANVTRNTVRNILYTAADDGDGILLLAGFSNSSVTRNSISNLNATNVGGYGMTGITVATSSATSGITLANNFIYDIKGTGYIASGLGDTVAGIRITGTGTGGINVYHNSVNLFGTAAAFNGATVTAAFLVNATTPTALDVRDNIFVNTSDNSTVTTDKSYAIYTNSTNAAFTNINYNDYFVSAAAPGVLGAINSADAATLTTLQTATAQDANSLAVDPLFASTTNLHLQPASTLIDAGITLAAVPVDFDGQTRPSGTNSDIGADEFVAPTAATASVQGRVSVGRGNGIRNVTVTLSGGNLLEPMRTTTGANGYYQFLDVPAGQTYIIEVSARRYTFNEASRIIGLTADIADVNFVGEATGLKSGGSVFEQ